MEIAWIRSFIQVIINVTQQKKVPLYNFLRKLITTYYCKQYSPICEVYICKTNNNVIIISSL